MSRTESAGTNLDRSMVFSERSLILSSSSCSTITYRSFSNSYALAMSDRSTCPWIGHVGGILIRELHSLCTWLSRIFSVSDTALYSRTPKLTSEIRRLPVQYARGAISLSGAEGRSLVVGQASRLRAVLRSAPSLGDRAQCTRGTPAVLPVYGRF